MEDGTEDTVDGASVTIASDGLDLEATARPGAELARGTIVGRYVVLSRLGAGAMGVVLAAYDPELDRTAALKLLKPSAAVGLEFRRFEAEAQVLARLDHPNIITIYDFGHDADTDCYYYAMSLIDGGTLSGLGHVTPLRT